MSMNDAEGLNESVSPIAVSDTCTARTTVASVGFNSHMPVDTWACTNTNVFGTTVITAEAFVGVPQRRLVSLELVS